MSDNKRKIDVLQTTLKSVLEGGSFDSWVTSEFGYDYGEAPKVKLVSVQNKGRLIRVLVYGKCPCCNVEHVRNFCNVRFVDNVVKDYVRRKFKMVKVVKCMLTHDADFRTKVEELNGRLEYATETEGRWSFWDMECFFLRKHPDIDSYAKFMTLRRSSDGVPFSRSDMVTFDEVNEKYYCSWAVALSSCVMSEDGSVLEGEEIDEREPMIKFTKGSMSSKGYKMLALVREGAIRKTDYVIVKFNS